jgi:hypothetical protein
MRDAVAVALKVRARQRHQLKCGRATERITGSKQPAILSSAKGCFNALTGATAPQFLVHGLRSGAARVDDLARQRQAQRRRRLRSVNPFD